MFKNFFLNIEVFDENAKKPTKRFEDAGFDVYNKQEEVIRSGENKLISLGWKCEFPQGYGLLFLNKSGRAAKESLLIGAELVDSNYRGEVFVNLLNVGKKRIVFEKHEKIAQFIIIPVWNGIIKITEISSETNRGAGCMGSTGLK